MITIPRLSWQSIAKWKRGIRIEDAVSGEVFPFFFTEENESREYEIPQHPVDSNINISDTIWQKPKVLNLKGLVSIDNYTTAIDMVDSARKLGRLFKVYYLGGLYENMQFTSISKTCTAEKATCFEVEVELQQIAYVTASTSVITQDTASSVSYSETSYLGQVSSTSSSTDSSSIAYKLYASM